MFFFFFFFFLGGGGGSPAHLSHPSWVLLLSYDIEGVGSALKNNLVLE